MNWLEIRKPIKMNHQCTGQQTSVFMGSWSSMKCHWEPHQFAAGPSAYLPPATLPWSLGAWFEGIKNLQSRQSLDHLELSCFCFLPALSAPSSTKIYIYIYIHIYISWRNRSCRFCFTCDKTVAGCRPGSDLQGSPTCWTNNLYTMLIFAKRSSPAASFQHSFIFSSKQSTILSWIIKIMKSQLQSPQNSPMPPRQSQAVGHSGILKQLRQGHDFIGQFCWEDYGRFKMCRTALLLLLLL